MGVGSFGSVYRGYLDQETTVIAVKVLNLLHRESFIAECEAMRNIRHWNLVKKINSLFRTDQEARDQASRSLDLLQRLNIVIDVASALDYLHHDCETPVVDYDLRPSNVLLDNEWSPASVIVDEQNSSPKPPINCQPINQATSESRNCWLCCSK
ncbi:hypothetical protein KPL71_011141 [Citrus sinensis]|uniref:Uncharacterized protein n=1 Tax=Citrus sinensis TaxID=2711 RepID=A0ACB8L1A1_CITSI|nr:hypothetical protein KPL71_011141 [Citrus sinensis]